MRFRSQKQGIKPEKPWAEVPVHTTPDQARVVNAHLFTHVPLCWSIQESTTLAKPRPPNRGFGLSALKEVKGDDSNQRQQPLKAPSFVTLTSRRKRRRDGSDGRLEASEHVAR